MTDTIVDVGAPPDGFHVDMNDETVSVCFHGYADLPTTRGHKVDSPEFTTRAGNKWRLELYPGGCAGSRVGYASLYIRNMSGRCIKMSINIGIRDPNDNEFLQCLNTARTFDPLGGEKAVWGGLLVSRERIMSRRANGTLTIEVKMRNIGQPAAFQMNTIYSPENPIYKNVLKRFMDEETADVVFDVCFGNEGRNKSRKKSKSSTTFHAHRFVLYDGAPLLAELCKPGSEGDLPCSVTISDVKPDVFRHMLYYLYGGKLSDEELKEKAKDLIGAANKYGAVSLKLEAEVSYVESTTLSIENVLDNLLYADAMNLALLKETVMDYILANKNDIIGKISFDNVPGSTVTDLLTAVARGENESSNDASRYNHMRVGALRQMLHEKGLDVDGSREAMIALLENIPEESA